MLKFYSSITVILLLVITGFVWALPSAHSEVTNTTEPSSHVVSLHMYGEEGDYKLMTTPRADKPETVVIDCPTSGNSMLSSTTVAEWSSEPVTKKMVIDGMATVHIFAQGNVRDTSFNVVLLKNGGTPTYQVDRTSTSTYQGRTQEANLIPEQPQDFQCSISITGTDSNDDPKRIILEPGDTFGIRVVFDGGERPLEADQYQGQLVYGSGADSRAEFPLNSIEIDIPRPEKSDFVTDVDQPYGILKAIVKTGFGVDDVKDFDIGIEGASGSFENMPVEQSGTSVTVKSKWYYDETSILAGGYSVTVTVTDNSNNEWSNVKDVIIVPPETEIDLYIKNSDLSFSQDTIVEGDTVTVSVTVHGVGKNWETIGVTVQFMDNDDIIEERSISIGIGEEKALTVEWSPRSGSHTLKVVVDPDNIIEENSEYNNMVQRTFPVTGFTNTSDNGNVTNATGEQGGFDLPLNSPFLWVIIAVLVIIIVVFVALVRR